MDTDHGPCFELEVRDIVAFLVNATVKFLDRTEDKSPELITCALCSRGPKRYSFEFQLLSFPEVL